MNHQNLDQLTLHQDSSIQQAIETLENTHLRIVFAVDSKNFLVGVLTDGDIRRALIKGMSLTSKIEKAINKNFFSVGPDATEAETLALMQENDILSVPVLLGGKVVDLITQGDINKRKVIENPVLLMAGGFGTRLQPLTNNCPKPLLKIGNIPIIEIIIRNFMKAGFKNFYISTHYKSSMIKEFLGNGNKFNITIKYLDETDPLGTAGCLGLLPRAEIDLPVIMMNADILTKVNFSNLLDHHNKSSSIVTMCVRTYTHQIPLGVVRSNEKNELVQIDEKPSFDYFVNSGMYVLDASVLSMIPENKKLDMPDFLNSIAHSESNSAVNLYPLHEYWMDIGQINDFNKAQIDFVANFND